MKSKRDRCLSLGNALVGMLRKSLMDRNVRSGSKTAARELVVEDGRVCGVVAEQEGRTLRVCARKAVLLAAGGFESNEEMRQRYLPHPTSTAWTSGSPASTGDAIRMGQSIGRRSRPDERSLVGADDGGSRRGARTRARDREGPARLHPRQQEGQALRQ
jgi:3-oxosteroid 1-dehydrogenase